MQAPVDELPEGLTTPSAAFRALKDIAFGSVAGMASKVFEHPFDLTKVRLQSQVLDGPSGARFDGPIDCLLQTWRKEGIRGLYRGLPAPIVGAMAENSSLFLSYNELQMLLRRVGGYNDLSAPLSLPQIAIAAAGAGGITSFLLTPIELVKCKMQVQMLATPVLPLSPSVSAQLRTLPGPFAIVGSVVREHGARGLWLGHTGTFLREVGGGAAWFCTKEAVAQRLAFARAGRRDAPPLAWESAASGACAGAAYNVALFPADTVKSAIQTAQELRPGSQEAKLGFVGMFRALYAAQGVRGLYAGCGVTIARSVPSSAMIFLIYDGLSKRYG